MKNPSDQKDSRKARSREQAQAMHQLLEEIEKGRRSGEEEGWLTGEAVIQYFEEKYHG